MYVHVCFVLLEVCGIQGCCPCSWVVQRPSDSSGKHQEVRTYVHMSFILGISTHMYVVYIHV